MDMGFMPQLRQLQERAQVHIEPSLPPREGYIVDALGVLICTGEQLQPAWEPREDLRRVPLGTERLVQPPKVRVLARDADAPSSQPSEHGRRQW